MDEFLYSLTDEDIEIVTAGHQVPDAKPSRKRARQPVPTFDYCTESDGRFAEALLCLRKKDSDGDMVSLRKRFEALPDGSVAPVKDGVRSGSASYVACLLYVDGVDAIHAAVQDVAAGVHGEAVLVRGEHSRYERWNWKRATRNTRYKTRSRDGSWAVKGVEERAPRCNITLDLDKVPNAAGIDPVLEPQRAAEWLRSLLSPALQSAKLSFLFSSSTGINPLADASCAPISAHLRGWLDEPLSGDDLGYLVTAEAEQIAHRLQAEYGLPDSELRVFLDPSLCRAGQQAFVLPPIVYGGRDPFIAARTRRTGIMSGRAEIDVGAWRLDLQVCDRIALDHTESQKRGEDVEQRIPASELIRIAQKNEFFAALARSAGQAIEGNPERQAPSPDLLQIADARDWLLSYRQRNLGRAGGSRGRTYAISAAAELSALLRARGGAMVGQRYFAARTIASLLSSVCVDEAELENAFRELANGVVSGEWMDTEWWTTSGAWPEVVKRFRAGNPVRCKRDFIVSGFKPTGSEIAVLGMITLVSDSDLRARIARQKNTALKARTRAANRTKPMVRNMNIGKPWEDLGISKSSYYAKKKAGEL